MVARTRAASEGYGRERTGTPDRLADTQILVSYRGTPWVRDDAASQDGGPAAGDRAPDAVGLMRQGCGFPLRLFDVLRGTEHVLIVHLPQDGAPETIADLSRWAQQHASHRRGCLRVVAVTTPAAHRAVPGVALLEDPSGAFAAAYGPEPMSYLVRPDGHLGWRGRSWREAGLQEHLQSLLLAA